MIYGLFGNKLEPHNNRETYKSYLGYNFNRIHLSFARISAFFLILIIGLLFLPWTQNIQGKGKVTALRPDARPQKVNSVISGRIEKWYVQEGDYVNKGDTLVFISEVKDKFFDPSLLDRTQLQIKSKELKVDSYYEKVKALDRQIDALLETAKLKIEQSRNKLKQSELKYQSDSIKLKAAQSDFSISEIQFERYKELYDQGLKSRTDLENYRQKFMDKESKAVDAENNLLSSANSVINSRIELSSIDNEYKNKLNKSRSEKSSTLAQLYEAEAEVTKMQNTFANFSIRRGMYYITSPQNGYVTQAKKSGIGEVLKENEELLSIMPSNYSLAAELYFEPLDVALLKKGQKVRLVFDGWPTIVFSGWPNSSFGTFGGVINAVDNFSTKGGKFRVLIAADPETADWPAKLRLNGGTVGYVLLKDVPIWYEMWRQFNGFPADFYEVSSSNNSNKSKSK
ncbi:HlyD family efflux transporter periplasmic adaptor subunit [Candidatus Kapabacteria bacterium]|nr:HlyD family efflux transporter periplasmic adaptor subunit [Candidatus Kapabacteria bacterium]